ncbi:hypothetical protein EDB83DRAFT_2525100 [Lactarius deliciosus]|nr:hypothetical protein EDB83DRAFT_2525100 [Lactarius deliciosus]
MQWRMDCARIVFVPDSFGTIYCADPSVYRSESPASTPSLDPSESTFPEIENIDPTDGVWYKVCFPLVQVSLVNPGCGLADLAEESTGEDDGVDDIIPGLTPEASVLGDNPAGTSFGVEYETVLAVGDSVAEPLASMSSRLARPARAITPHRPPTPLSFPLRSILPLGNIDTPLHAPSVHTSYSHLRDPSETPTPPLHYPPPRRAISPSGIHTHESGSHTLTHFVPTPPSTDVLSTHHHARPRGLTRRASVTGTIGTGLDTDARIVLRPALHGALLTLATLANPTTPSPPTPARSPTSQCAPVRAAHRPHCHVPRLARAGVGRTCSSVSPPSEFDAEDMDRYFCTRDKLTSVAMSEPTPASLAYGSPPGLHGRVWVPVRRARPESLDA